MITNARGFWKVAALLLCFAVLTVSDFGVTAEPIHPSFVLLDAAGTDVLTSGAPLSQSKTCGGCHDTDFIARHSAHARADGDSAPPPLRTWENASAWFGGWDPLVYELAPGTDLKAWLTSYGQRHVGGGPARGAGVELDCMLCHLSEASLSARQEALRDAAFEWASTATLSDTGLVEVTEDAFAWNATAFSQGRFPVERLRLSRPTSERCGQCHQHVHRDSSPLDTWNAESARSGAIFSSQPVRDSAFNLANKERLSRAFDVHAERLLECADCHHSRTRAGSVSDVALRHLRFDPRRPALHEVLRRPSHELASSGNGQEAGLRRCTNCHDPSEGHEELPSPSRHFSALACESCHIPEAVIGALSHIDWTALDADGEPLRSYRGSSSNPIDAMVLARGTEPTLLLRRMSDGQRRYAPHNLLTTSYWVTASPLRPVSREALMRVFQSETLQHALDADADGRLSSEERRLTNPQRARLVAELLEAEGVEKPTIVSEVEAVEMHHGVTEGAFVVSDCTECHSSKSRLRRPTLLTTQLPGGVAPHFVDDAALELQGSIEIEGGVARFVPAPDAQSMRHSYVWGADRISWIDWLGISAVTLVLLLAVTHGLGRFLSRRKHAVEGITPHADKSITDEETGKEGSPR